MRFYACNVSDGTALEKLMDNLREEFTTNPPLAGAYQPKRGELCAAKFVDDQWYRAKVEKLSGKDATVIYIDFGNKAVIPTAKCAALPASFHNPHGFVKEYLLAFMTLAPDEDYAEAGLKAIKE